MKLWMMKTLHLLGGRPVINRQWVTLSRGEKSKPDFVSHYIASDSDADAADDESPTAGAFTKWFYSWRN